MNFVKFVVAALCVATLSGCATMNYYGGRNNSSMLGGVGAVVGSALTRGNPVVGMALGGAAGYYYGQQLDRQEAAVGRTTCTYSASKNGTDSNGYYSQGARSSKTIPGYKQDCN